MILVDTSIWINHFRSSNEILRILLAKGQVLCHHFVVGELSLGNLNKRRATLADLDNLPRITVAEFAEVIHFIEEEKLYGSGIGYVDASLLVSARLTPGTALWTDDRRLFAVADRLALAAKLIQ